MALRRAADEIKIGTRVVPIMASLQSGYIKWQSNTAVEHASSAGY
jgi:hypothetical protein